MAYYTYILKSKKNGSYFYGQTKDLNARLRYHNRGMGQRTKDSRPWVLLAYKEFNTRGGAMSMERKLREQNTGADLERFIGQNGFTVL